MLKDRDTKSEQPEPAKRGRKRDATRDAAILDAALEVLGEVGYEGMTMDMVATRAKAGKATVYRRWSSKPDLVVDAVKRLDAAVVDFDDLPDTGSLRGDLIALVGLEDGERAERRVKVMAGLSSAMSRDLGLAEVGSAAVVGPWIEVNRRLIARAIERGEVMPTVDTEILAHVVPMMGSGYRTLAQPGSAGDDLLVRLIDHVLLPALRGASVPATETEAGPAG